MGERSNKDDHTIVWSDEQIEALSPTFSLYRRRWVEGLKSGKKEGTIFHKMLMIMAKDAIPKVDLLRVLGPLVIGGFGNRVIASVGLTNSEITELESQVELEMIKLNPTFLEYVDPSESVLSSLERRQMMQLLTGRMGANASEIKNFMLNLIKDHPQVQELIAIMFGGK